MITKYNLQIRKKDSLFILIIVFFALFFRIMYLKDYINSDIYPLFPFSDSASYYSSARAISSGDIWGNKSFMVWPLYIHFLALLLTLSKNSVFFVNVIQFILGISNCVLIYFIGRELFNRTVAFIAGLLCVWYGLFIFFEGLLMYSSLSLFLNSLLFLFLLYIQKNINKKNLFEFGVFLGICTLAQANIIIFGILATVWVLLEKKEKFSKIIYHLLCFMLGLSMVVGAVTLRNYLVEKDFVLISGNIGLNFYLGNNPEANGLFHSPSFFTPSREHMHKEAEIIARITTGKKLKTSEVSRFWFKKSLYFIKNKPIAYLKLLVKKLHYLFSPKEFVHDQEYAFIVDKAKIFKILFLNLRFILPFGLLGICLGIKKFREVALLYIILISLAFASILFFITSKYRIAMVPFLIVFAAYGIFSLVNAINEKKYRRFMLLCLLLLVFFTIFNYDLFIKEKVAYRLERHNKFIHHLDRALLYEIKLDYQNALEEYRLAEKIEPNNLRLKHAFGTIYLQLNDFERAEDYLIEAIRSGPFCFDSYYNLGFLYNQQQHFDKAIAILTRAVLLNQEDAALHFELAKAYKGKGEIQRSIEEFKLSLKYIDTWRTKDMEAI